MNAKNVDAVVELERSPGPISLWAPEDNELGNNNKFISACLPVDPNVPADETRAKLSRCDSKQHREHAYTSFRGAAGPGGLFGESTVCRSHLNTDNEVYARAKVRAQSDVDCSLVTTRHK